MYYGKPKAPTAASTHRSCEKCAGDSIDVNPVPGKMLQFWCNKCNHMWFETHQTHFVPVGV